MTTCEQCEGQGHVYDKEKDVWKRCVCIQEQIRGQQLGVFYTSRPLKKTNLEDIKGKDAVIEAPLEALRPHIACVLLELQEQQKRVVTLDAYRLIEIFLEKDQEFQTNFEVTDCDLLIILLGFGDPRNRYLPELLIQVLGRRQILRLPTWVVLGVERSAIGLKYGIEVAARLEAFKQVAMRD